MIRQSLGGKILGWACLVCAGTLAALCSISYVWQRRATTEAIARMGHQVSGLMALAIDDPMVRGESETLDGIFRKAAALHSDIAVHLTDSEGRIRYSTLPRAVHSKLDSVCASPEAARLLAEALRHDSETGALTDLGGHPTFLRVKTLANETRCQSCHGTNKPILGAMVVLKDASEDWERLQNSNRLILGLSLGGLVAMALLLVVMITRMVTRPLKVFGSVLGQVAEGSLVASVPVASQDEVGEMGTALNATVRQLREAFLEIQEAAATIAQASGEIATGNQDLSTRTEEQAAGLQQTAGSLESFADSVSETAQNAREAASAANGALAMAQDGTEAVAGLLTAMDEITTASSRISDVSGVVDEIAFQTNLLALNAAVEAARAGEQGRGFAVVATEVRALARRSSEAAREIKGLIRDSVNKAQEGHTAAGLTGRIIQEVVGHTQKVSSLMRQIARATESQREGIAEINKAVSQMDGVTQQNAALVEEAAAAAESLDSQARTLASILRRYRTQG